MADSQRVADETDAEWEERIIRLTREAYTTPSDDPVREYCRLREHSAPVILGGLDHLLDLDYVRGNFANKPINGTSRARRTTPPRQRRGIGPSWSDSARDSTSPPTSGGTP